MFYAVLLCGNPNHPRYLTPIEFMVEDEEENPIATDTEDEMKERLECLPIYQAGWVKIIEIDL